jgi:hypothetical protein
MLMRRQLGVLLVLVALAWLSACGSAQPAPSGINGIAVVNRVTLTLGGPSQFPLPGGFGLSDLVPYAHADVFVRAAGDQPPGKIVAEVRADANGIFRFTLPPGQYVVEGEPAGPRFAKSVIVRPGVYVRVVVQTGIRF